MIRSQKLVKDFGGVRAVDQFSFEVEPGEIYGLLGPNGAGKTTTTRILSCLLRPTSGMAWVAGHPIDTGAHLIRSRIGILTEQPGLYGRLTPLEYLDFFASMQDMPRAKRAARIEELLRLVGMWEWRRSVMRPYSKGMQQRVAIARALLHEPEVLFFDEPTAALDPEAAKRIRDHLLELARDHGRTVLLCTHNLTEAEQLCRRLSIVRSGRQIAEGTPSQLAAGMLRTMSLRAANVPPEFLGRLDTIQGASNLTVDTSLGLVRYETPTPESTNPEVVRAAVAHGVDVLSLEERQLSLETVYLSLVRGERTNGHATLEDSRAGANGVVEHAP